MQWLVSPKLSFFFQRYILFIKNKKYIFVFSGKKHVCIYKRKKFYWEYFEYIKYINTLLKLCENISENRCPKNEAVFINEYFILKLVLTSEDCKIENRFLLWLVSWRISLYFFLRRYIIEMCMCVFEERNLFVCVKWKRFIGNW